LQRGLQIEIQMCMHLQTNSCQKGHPENEEKLNPYAQKWPTEWSNDIKDSYWDIHSDLFASSKHQRTKLKEGMLKFMNTD